MPSLQQELAGKYLTFYLDNQTYGLPIGCVQEINQHTRPTKVPQTPIYLEGVINLRGKIVPLVDLRLKFGMCGQARDKKTCVIVVESGDDNVTGIIVDAVEEVVHLEANQIDRKPGIGSDEEMKHILAMGKSNNKVIILLDIARAMENLDLTLLPEEIETLVEAAS